MACSPEKQKRIDKLLEIHDKWFDKNGDVGKSIYKVVGDDVKFFKQFYEAEMKVDFDYGELPSMKQLKKLDRKMGKFARQMVKKPGNFAKWFYLPEEVLKHNPVTKKYFESMIRAGNYYRGEMETVTSNLDNIVRLLDLSNKETGIMGRLGIGRKNAQKEIAKRNAEYQRLLKLDKDKADAYYRDNLRDLSSDGDLASTQRLWEIMVEPKWLTRNKKKAIEKYGTNMVQAADLWHNTMAPALWKSLNTGIRDYVSVLENSKSALGIEQTTIDNIKNNLLTVKNKKTGQMEMAKQESYFPTQVLDIIPTFNTLTESLFSGKGLDKITDVNKYINNITKDIANRLKVTGNVYETNRNKPNRVSKNVISIIDSYAKATTRFNYSSRVTKETVTALKDIMRMEGKDMDDHLKFLADYIKDTHSSALGLDHKQSKFGKISRAITSWQFMSKLGFNFRGAARNATQSLQNFIYFGGEGLKNYYRFNKGGKMNELMDKAMKEHGVYFTNLEEMAIPTEFLPSTKMVDGKLVEVNPGLAENFTRGLERIAKISGKPMQWVENNVNRSLTFKIAFAKMHSELSGRKDIIAKRIESAKTGEGKEIEKRVADEIYNRSSNFAANMVKELHFEYSPFAKPKALRTSAGSVLGQFSTFGINFFNYQRKILSQGTESILSREWNSPEQWRMFRLGLTYLAIDSLISPLLSTDMGMLVQNDTKERISQLHTWFTGSEKEKKRVFFGKGPLLSTFGGPFVSDLITIGQLTNFMGMEKSDWLSYMAGYEDHAFKSKDKKVMDFVRMLNGQVARTSFSTIPKAVNGTGLTTLIGNELGLYGSSNLDKQRKNIYKNARRITPRFMDKHLTPLDEQKSIAKGYQDLIKGKPKSGVSNEELDEIMTSLSALKGDI